MTDKQDKPAAKSAAERKAAERARKASAGITEVRGIWAAPQDHPAIRADALKHAAELTAARMTPPAKKRRKAQGESNE